jgi:RNA polymerase sigma-70 factor (ECF subfamily)
MSEEQVNLEERIRSAWDARDYDTAATLVIEAYADEIASFLGARLRSAGAGQEAFSMFAEDLWVGLPQFGWRCSMRTWAYTLARNAANRYATSPHQRAERRIALSNAGQVSVLVERLRSATQVHLRTDVKDRFRALRERLEPDDQMLLILRVDRDMAWRDIALTMAGDSNLDDDAVARDSARLRKAFERVKSELKRMAREEGLLGSE